MYMFSLDKCEIVILGVTKQKISCLTFLMAEVSDKSLSSL